MDSNRPEKLIRAFGMKISKLECQTFVYIFNDRFPHLKTLCFDIRIDKRIYRLCRVFSGKCFNYVQFQLVLLKWWYWSLKANGSTKKCVIFLWKLIALLNSDLGFSRIIGWNTKSEKHSDANYCCRGDGTEDVSI